MAVEHTFYGTWEIVSCTFENALEYSGLEGIKFRLDDTNDITWYNDLVSPHPESKDCSTCSDSAGVLFSCETFDVNETNPRLIFGAFAGHSIEFRTNTLTPTDTLVLDCENWYALECKRLKENQAAGQEKEFSFSDALKEAYFSDVVIKSSNGVEFSVHASILRLNGFDCSMCTPPKPTGQQRPYNAAMQQAIEISVTLTEEVIKPYNLTANSANSANAAKKANDGTKCETKDYLSLSSDKRSKQSNNSNMKKDNGKNSTLTTNRAFYLSSSFNCLSSNDSHANCGNVINKSLLSAENGLEELGGMKRYPYNSSSDSQLQTSPHSKNIFNFCPDFIMEPPNDTSTSICNTRKPPLSPYKARSPSPFPSSMETPPSSPLTPVSVLNNLPSFLLSPIIHWLYTESLLPDLEEDVCEKLINFTETLPTLSKLVERTKKYLKLIRLKKYVVNIVMDMHRILNRICQAISPATISHEPTFLYAIFKDSLKDCAIACTKILQFCNIFIRDASDISRYQKNEIIKYIRSRIPIFMSQVQQLLKNIHAVLVSLSLDEKHDLVNYLVPEIESALTLSTDVVEEIKNSLEKMCKDLKCSHLDLSMKNHCDDAVAIQIQNNQLITMKVEKNESNISTFFNPAPLSPRPRRGPPIGLTLYDSSNEKQRYSAENDLKFVLYMYEVRKMRDIYGRISAALEIIRDKKTTFCEMDLVSKAVTITQNLERLILDMPSYIKIIESLSDRLDDKLGWKEFKFCFKLATTQINGVIVKLIDHKAALKDPINQLCKIVKKAEFTESLVELGLLEPSNILQNDIQSSDNNKSSSNYMTSMEDQHSYNYKNVKLNLIRHLCEPPIAASSSLSKNALRLLHSAQLADMEFEVHSPIDDYEREHSEKDNMETEMNSNKSKSVTSTKAHIFKAHRVIVSSRCEWFKKALMSGMKESITRKIVISETSPVIFRRLLLYLYGAPIDKTVGAEQICELMLLADRYSIDDLKELCENTLNSLIDDDSVICLLGIADHYNATALKSKCLSYISQNSQLTKSRLFKELSHNLQLEVMDLIHWFGRITEPWNDVDTFKQRNSFSRRSLKSPSKPRSRKSSPSYT